MSFMFGRLHRMNTVAWFLSPFTSRLVPNWPFVICTPPTFQNVRGLELRLYLGKFTWQPRYRYDPRSNQPRQQVEADAENMPFPGAKPYARNRVPRISILDTIGPKRLESNHSDGMALNIRARMVVAIPPSACLEMFRRRKKVNHSDLRGDWFPCNGCP